MCLALEAKHIQCGHLDGFSIVSLCASARRMDSPCDKSQCSIKTEISPPPLCASCYRRTEKEICDKADEARRDITHYLDNIKRELRENRNLDSLERRLLRALRDDAVNMQNENRAERALTLTEFRESQGVWGDG